MYRNAQMMLGESGSDRSPPRPHVREYRAYILNWDGHIKSRIDLLCLNEEDARERAQQLVDGAAVELWEGPRRIARFDPQH